MKSSNKIHFFQVLNCSCMFLNWRWEAKMSCESWSILSSGPLGLASGSCKKFSHHRCLFTLHACTLFLICMMRGTLEILDLFHSMEIFWKYCRRLENPISIVLPNSMIWKCCPWYGNIMEILWKYSANKTYILCKRFSFSSG